jgi:oligopeptide transport system ATP-binding protein
MTSTTSAASTDTTAADTVLSVRDLRVHFPTSDGVVKAVDGLDFNLSRGKTLGIVGESGSGKSVSSSAILGLHDPKRTKISGEIWLNGVDLLTLSEEQMRKRRGQEVAMIFQDPLSAMHPYYTVGNQIIEAYRVHNDVSKKAARDRAIEMLDRVGIPQPDRRVDDYPHQFSGGMRQRAMIAMSLALDPELLIADEPTTALDVTVQAQIMDLLAEIQKERDMGMILITHDLGVVADVADRISVMYAGRIVEHADVYELFRAPGHPYTESLLESLPRLDLKGQELKTIKGLPPSLTNIPPGCPFNPRCPRVFDRCVSEVPAVHNLGMGRTSRCHIAEEVVARG